MKRSFLVALTFITVGFGFSCGGGPAVEEVVLENDYGVISVDLCKEEETDKGKECLLQVPQPLFTIKLKAEKIQTSFSDFLTTSYQVRECKFEWWPLNDWTPDIEVTNEFRCNYAKIPADGEGELKISISADLMNELYDYYFNVAEQKPLSYVMKIDLVISPATGGEEKTYTTFVTLDFLNLPDEAQTQTQTQ